MVERTSSSLFTLQMIATARAGAGGSQEAGTPSGLPLWWQGPQMLGPSSAAVSRHGSSELELKWRNQKNWHAYGASVSQVTAFSASHNSGSLF